MDRRALLQLVVCPVPRPGLGRGRHERAALAALDATLRLDRAAQERRQGQGRAHAGGDRQDRGRLFRARALLLHARDPAPLPLQPVDCDDPHARPSRADPVPPGRLPLPLRAAAFRRRRVLVHQGPLEARYGRDRRRAADQPARDTDDGHQPRQRLALRRERQAEGAHPVHGRGGDLPLPPLQLRGVGRPLLDALQRPLVRPQRGLLPPEGRRGEAARGALIRSARTDSVRRVVRCRRLCVLLPWRGAGDGCGRPAHPQGDRVVRPLRCLPPAHRLGDP